MQLLSLCESIPFQFKTITWDPSLLELGALRAQMKGRPKSSTTIKTDRKERKKPTNRNWA
jgi:hypothetical protein